jgi:hypothetical protein
MTVSRTVGFHDLTPTRTLVYDRRVRGGEVKTEFNICHSWYRLMLLKSLLRRGYILARIHCISFGGVKLSFVLYTDNPDSLPPAGIERFGNESTGETLQAIRLSETALWEIE